MNKSTIFLENFYKKTREQMINSKYFAIQESKVSYLSESLGNSGVMLGSLIMH